MPAIVCNASFSTTCPRKPNSIQNASVLMDFLNGVFNSQTEKLPGVLQNAEYLLAAKIALINFKTPEIAKMLHNVYKGSCTGKYLSFEATFHRRFAVVALNVGFLQVGESHL
jgi:hypothetical protein